MVVVLCVFLWFCLFCLGLLGFRGCVVGEGWFLWCLIFVFFFVVRWVDCVFLGKVIGFLVFFSWDWWKLEVEFVVGGEKRRGWGVVVREGNLVKVLLFFEVLVCLFLYRLWWKVGWCKRIYGDCFWCFFLFGM